jgi:hypothetical protein
MNKQEARLHGEPSGRRRRLLLVAPAVIGLAVITAACGGGSPRAAVASLGTTTTTVPTTAAATGGSAPGPSATGASAPGGALVQYARCMHSHGVPSFPQPGSLAAPGAIRDFKGEIVRAVGSLGSSPRFHAAQRACAKYYGPTPAPAPQVSPQEMRKLLAVSRCMRAHGVTDFPDPNPTTGAMDPPPGLNRTSPLVLAALSACSSLGKAAGLGPPNTGK